MERKRSSISFSALFTAAVTTTAAKRRSFENGVVGLGIVSATNFTCTSVVSSAKPTVNFFNFQNKLLPDDGDDHMDCDDEDDDDCYDESEGFLSCCDLCKKPLHGLDIFIYRGETAFCSVECRENHIRNGCRENCGFEARKPLDLCSSPHVLCGHRCSLNENYNGRVVKA